jgi:hypothetical protein
MDEEVPRSESFIKVDKKHLSLVFGISSPKFPDLRAFHHRSACDDEGKDEVDPGHFNVSPK